MRFLRFALAAVSLIASTAFASPADPKNGAEYLTLANPQPVQAVGNKVEVIEFFMYHCPACNSLEPHLQEWVKKQGDKIVFRRIHFPYRGDNDPEAHLYLTLEAMGKAHEITPKVFRAFHVDRIRLDKDEAILEWIPKQGIDKAKFLEFWNSFGVLTKLKRLQQVMKSYNIESAPSLVVDGRFVTSPSSIATANPSITASGPMYVAVAQVLDALVAKAAKEKPAPAAAAKTASK